MPPAVVCRLSSREALHRHQHVRFFNDCNGISQRASEAFKPDFGNIPVRELQVIAETDAVRAKKMNVHVSRAAMGVEFEMVMLDVSKTVGHFAFATADLLRPEGLSGSFNPYQPGNGSKIRGNGQ